MRRRWISIVLLGALLPLAGCIEWEGEPPEPETAGFEFLVDPATNRVLLVEQLGSGLVPAAEGPRVLIPGTEIELAYFDYAFLPGNVLEIYATFENVTEFAYFMGETRWEGLSFTPAQTPEEGNFLSSVEPQGYHYDLGNGSLRPGEVMREHYWGDPWFTFTVHHRGEPFHYFVNVRAVVGDVSDVIGAGEPLEQGDKLVYVGSRRPHPDLEDPYWHGYTMMRYLSDGSPDTNFGADGETRVLLYQHPDAHVDVWAALQSDGHIVVTGDGPMPHKSDGFAARHGPDGERLVHFGIGGSDYTYLGAPVILPGDNVLITGTNIHRWDWYFTPELDSLVRLYPKASLLHPDGLTLYGGGSSDPGGDAVMARALPDGNLDAAFGGIGFVTINVGGSDDAITVLALQPGGSILASGESNACPSLAFSVLVHPDGTYDPPVCSP